MNGNVEIFPPLAIPQIPHSFYLQLLHSAWYIIALTVAVNAFKHVQTHALCMIRTCLVEGILIRCTHSHGHVGCWYMHVIWLESNSFSRFNGSGKFQYQQKQLF